MKPTDADLAPHGWASGAIVFEKCPNCGGPFEGVDRRAIRCRPCAVTSWRAANRDYGTALGDKLGAAGIVPKPAEETVRTVEALMEGVRTGRPTLPNHIVFGGRR